ncbi:Phosphoenolpyruvate synthase regulatory protein [Marinomonas aquimarina]|uniref:Putative phosphoenolpyruvate synthase regulatory protein n=1 Tax=Marinomonas aquimarina TaxID=295068 RepID=A0A1A8T3G6_9GAMM|nr:pyruvate, water dikinase regulatory protein [Marinomonas aquimarina]SBS26702.1 Phosphoenolpyruvate synthase regulatory protein [Marinomonas aquimarina]
MKVYFVSDGTAITAEVFGQAMLSFFDVAIQQQSVPFLSTLDKAYGFCQQLQQEAANGENTLVFFTISDPAIRSVIEASEGHCYNLFGELLSPIEQALGVKAQPNAQKAHGIKEGIYDGRIDAINYALANDDGASVKNYDAAEIILLGVSRSGKTPTSLYLAMQYGIKAANYPLTEDDFNSVVLPKVLKPHKNKLFGLTIDAQRLHEIRTGRMAETKYASARQCRYELDEVEAIYRQERIPFLNTTRLSVEEISTKIMAEMHLSRNRR